MDNNKKYLQVFMQILEVEENEAVTLKYRDIDKWDSIGHLSLMNEIETEFDIMIDTDDMIDFNSFEKGKEILASNYDVEF